MAARKKDKSELLVDDPDKGYDELNLGRLSLISGQKTVPPTLKRWQKNIITPDGRPVVITCAALDDQLVPHGLDNDFMVGLLNLSFEHGLPDAPFTISAYKLLKAAGFPDTAQYYRSLEESLVRLNKAQYTIDEGWFAHGTQRWTTQSFAQISYLSYVRSAAGIHGTSLITVQLAPPIMDSLRAGYIKPLDLNFYRTLSQPLVRAVYRQLDALQFDDSTPSGLVKELTFPLMGWAVRLGIVSDRPDNVERTLRPAHDELLAKKYIQQIEITGRGKNKVIRYVFGTPPEAQYPMLAQLLIERGVKKAVAVRMSTVFSEKIEEAVRRFDYYIKNAKTHVKNPPGLLISMIQRSENYEDLPGYSVIDSPDVIIRAVNGAAALNNSADIEAIESRDAAHVSALEGTELIDWIYTQLKLLGVMKRLKQDDKARLEAALENSTIDGRRLVHEARRRALQGAEALDGLVNELRQHFTNSPRNDRDE